MAKTNYSSHLPTGANFWASSHFKCSDTSSKFYYLLAKFCMENSAINFYSGEKYSLHKNYFSNVSAFFFYVYTIIHCQDIIYVNASKCRYFIYTGWLQLICCFSLFKKKIIKNYQKVSWLNLCTSVIARWAKYTNVTASKIVCCNN